MGAAIDKINARLVAGDNVEPSEYVAAKAEDEFAEMQAAANAERAAQESEAARLAAIEATIDALAVDVDAASEVLADSVVTALEALKAADDARTKLEAIVRAGCHTLAHNYEFFTTADGVMGATGGRVVYMPIDSVTGREPHKLAAGPHWITWRDDRLAERAGRAATS
jgi:hypothetical protein